jgi:xanthine dehydrogenase large subunit
VSIGKNTPHDSGELHVTGRALFTDDISLSNDSLHLAFGLSSIAKGSIIELDLSKVVKSDGVITVISAKDLLFTSDTSPSANDEPLLSDGTIHFLGQPIFLVIASSHINARKACRLAKVNYKKEKPVLTIEDAIESKSIIADGECHYIKGTPEVAINAAPINLTDSFYVGGQEHFYLEGQVAIATPQEDGGLVIYSSTQHPTEIQHKVAEATGLKMHEVRVEVRRMGGAFGGKESQGNALAIACAIATKATGKTCKMRYDRDDDIIITGKRHDFRIDYDVGFNEDGKILGIKFKHYVRCGWSQDLSLPVADRAMLHSDNTYNLEDVSITSHRLKTNTQSNTAFRGFGGPQGIIGIERAIDHIASHLNLDPTKVRTINFYRSGTLVKENLQKPQTTPYGMPVVDSISTEITETLLKTANYKSRLEGITAWNKNNSVIKKGIALSPVKFGISFTLTHLNQAGAIVNVYTDGSVYLNHGGTEMGQGLFIKVAQIAAETFGIGIDRIKISATDTAKVPNTSATAASSGADLNGMATKIACRKIVNRIKKVLSKENKIPEDQIIFENGNILIGTKLISFKEGVLIAYENRVSLSSTGYYATPELSWDRKTGVGRPFFYFSYGAAITEVAVDTLTGETNFLQADILHDCGRSLNPAIDLGQIEGGYIQGLGWLTTEELVWDKRGALKTFAPSTYKIPCASDRPKVLNIELWDAPNRLDTVYNSKAVGEPPLILGISAWLAISNAISQCGTQYPHLNTPATPEEILKAIDRARNGV